MTKMPCPLHSEMNRTQSNAKDRILRRHDVQLRTGLSKSAIYQLMNEGDFPSNFQISAKAVGWLESSVDHWIQSRAQAAAEQ